MIKQFLPICWSLCALWHSSLGLVEHIPLTLNVELNELQEVACDKFKYYAVEITDPCQDLRVRVNHVAGEPDLYVAKGNNKYPNETTLAWTSYQWGSEDLTISSWDPEFEVGTFYIGVHAYCGDDVSTSRTPSKFTLLAESVETAHPHTEITVDHQIWNEHIDAQAYRYYRFCLPSRCSDVKLTLEHCLDSAICPTSYGFPELLISRSIVQPKINDHSWKLASIRRSITLRRDDPDVQPGHHFVSVYGWCTPDYLCSDESTCGPCANVPNMPYNLTLTMTTSADCFTTASAPTFLPTAFIIFCSSVIFLFI